MPFCGEFSEPLPHKKQKLLLSTVANCQLFLLQIAMVSAWFMDSSDEDQRLPHHLDPPQPVSLEDLANCGVLYWKVTFLSLMDKAE